MNLISDLFSNTLVAFIILIAIIIFVHEFGHFLAGKIFGIQVEEFSIGFGPSALQFQKGPTVYRLNWLPLGGYVRFFGANLEEDIPLEHHHKSFLHAKLYKRAIVSFAGPLANFVLSFFIMFAMVNHGIPTLSNAISVIPHSVAEKSGLQSGDKILSINDAPTKTWNQLVEKITNSANQTLTMSVERESKTIILSVVPELQLGDTIYGTKEKSGRIGIKPDPKAPQIEIKANSIHEAILQAGQAVFNQMKMIFKGIQLLITGSVPLSNLGGPIAVANIAGDAAKAGFMVFFLTLSFISVNIGMVNLLPLPALDGGTLLLNAVEALYGKPLPQSVQIAVQRVGIFFILFLFVLVFYNDLLRIFHR